ncbi:MAG TPA: HEAT repeat domain-containing protein [Polyangiales bacterium]
MGLLPLAAAVAQDEVVLLRMLHDGNDFRVRTQAAFALGRKHDAHYLDSLEGALHDKHPVVRAAAATALGEIGSALALPALQLAAKDSAPAVVAQARAAMEAIKAAAAARAGVAPAGAAELAPRAPGARLPAGTRYALLLGDMHNQSGYSGDELSQTLMTSLAHELSSWHRVVLLAPRDASGVKLVRDQGVPVFRLDANVTQISREPLGGQVSVHCEVSILLLDEPARTLRSVLKGAATGLEAPTGPLAPQEHRIARKAVAGAVRSALHNATSVIENAAARATVKPSDSASAALH